MAINLAAGLLGAMIVFDLSRRFTRSMVWALAPTILFVWAASVLAYSQSGTSYVAGLGVLMAGVWWQLTARKTTWANLLGAAALFGLASLIWLPYCLAFLAACCGRKFIELPDEKRERMSWTQAFLSLVTCSAIMLGGVAMAAALAGVRTSGDLKSWLVSTGHAMHQNRQLVRAVTGCARLFLDFGADGVILKRFAFHDPYAPVGAVDLFLHSLWKVALFYLFVAGAMVLAWFSIRARATLVPFLVTAAPALFAAVVIFEPSGPERLLPVLPFLLLVVAAGLGQAERVWPARGVVCLFAILLPVLNWATFAGTASAATRQGLAQLDLLRSRIHDGDSLIVVTRFETAVQWPASHPFDVSRQQNFRVFWAIDPILAEGKRWPVRVAHDIADVWSQGREVWVEKAALDPRPDVRLLWVEGDDPQVHWTDVPIFFHSLQFDSELGGSDGFLHLSHSPANEAVVHELTQ